ncbi:MAG: hypothetical protein E3K36_07365 [Candidatus Brocadia sp.]|nr:hypothetical protein [Candidatus Brocadia sp.]
MKKAIGYLFLLMFLVSVCHAGDVKVLQKKSYDLELESKPVKAGSSFVEYFDIDSLGNKIPDEIAATVQTGDWIASLPRDSYVSLDETTTDKIIEHWGISFAAVRSGGRVVFTRTIINNDIIDRESYAWNLKLKCRYLKYK